MAGRSLTRLGCPGDPLVVVPTEGGFVPANSLVLAELWPEQGRDLKSARPKSGTSPCWQDGARVSGGPGCYGSLRLQDPVRLCRAERPAFAQPASDHGRSSARDCLCAIPQLHCHYHKLDSAARQGLQAAGITAACSCSANCKGRTGEHCWLASDVGWRHWGLSLASSRSFCRDKQTAGTKKALGQSSDALGAARSPLDYVYQGSCPCSISTRVAKSAVSAPLQWWGGELSSHTLCKRGNWPLCPITTMQMAIRADESQELDSQDRNVNSYALVCPAWGHPCHAGHLQNEQAQQLQQSPGTQLGSDWAHA